MNAIIQSGGKQLKVKAGDIVEVESSPWPTEQKLFLQDRLMLFSIRLLFLE